MQKFKPYKGQPALTRPHDTVSFSSIMDVPPVYMQRLQKLDELERSMPNRVFFVTGQPAQTFQTMLRMYNDTVQFFIKEKQSNPDLEVTEEQRLALDYIRTNLAKLNVHKFAPVINTYHWYAAKFIRDNTPKERESAAQAMIEAVLQLPDYHLEEYMQLVENQLKTITDTSRSAVDARTKTRNNLMDALWYMDELSARVPRYGLQTMVVTNENVPPYAYISVLQNEGNTIIARLVKVAQGESFTVSINVGRTVLVLVHMPVELYVPESADEIKDMVSGKGLTDEQLKYVEYIQLPSMVFRIEPIAQYGQMLSGVKNVHKDLESAFSGFANNMYAKYIQRIVETRTCNHYFGVHYRFDGTHAPQFSEEQRRARACPDTNPRTEIVRKRPAEREAAGAGKPVEKRAAPPAETEENATAIVPVVPLDSIRCDADNKADDELIYAYIKFMLWRVTTKETARQALHAVDSLAFSQALQEPLTTLLEKGYRVRAFPSTVNTLLIPIHSPDHWSLAVVQNVQSILSGGGAPVSVLYFDTFLYHSCSVIQELRKAVAAYLAFMRSESPASVEDTFKTILDRIPAVTVMNIPQQTDSHSCGYWMLVAAHNVIRAVDSGTFVVPGPSQLAVTRIPPEWQWQFWDIESFVSNMRKVFTVLKARYGTIIRNVKPFPRNVQHVEEDLVLTTEDRTRLREREESEKLREALGQVGFGGGKIRPHDDLIELLSDDEESEFKKPAPEAEIEVLEDDDDEDVTFVRASESKAVLVPIIDTERIVCTDATKANDELVNSYMQFMLQRITTKDDVRNRVFIVNSLQFEDVLKSIDVKTSEPQWEKVSGWSRKKDIPSSTDILLIPICSRDHWSLLVVNHVQNPETEISLLYFDTKLEYSRANGLTNILAPAVRLYLAYMAVQRSTERRGPKVSKDAVRAVFESIPLPRVLEMKVPQQLDSFSCGFWMLSIAHNILRAIDSGVFDTPVDETIPRSWNWQLWDVHTFTSNVRRVYSVLRSKLPPDYEKAAIEANFTNFPLTWQHLDTDMIETIDLSSE